MLSSLLHSYDLQKMFGDILTAILRPENKEDQLISSIASENQVIRDELFIIENSFDKLPMKDILETIQQNFQPKSATYLDDPTQQTIKTLESFYEVCKSSEKQNKTCQHLLEQANQIHQLANDYDLLGTFALFQTLPQKESLEYIEQMIENLDKQLLNWHNQQNINLFQAQDEEVTQSWTHVVLFVQKLKNKANLIYRSMVQSSYSIEKSNIVIYSDYIQTVWSQSSDFFDDFLGKLQNCLDLLISYDINNRQYTILIYKFKIEEDSYALTQETKIMFQNSQIGLHLEAILQSIDNLKLFLYRLEESTAKDKQYKILNLTKQLMNRYKGYFEHMIPYLPLDKRRVFMEMMTFGGEGNQMTLYELLVNLKTGRQDADIMVGTIRQILQRMQTSKETIKTVLSFLDLAKQSKAHYSTVMFISDQMIEGLEDQQVDEEKMKVIKELLGIREEMRVKIHAGQ